MVSPEEWSLSKELFNKRLFPARLKSRTIHSNPAHLENKESRCLCPISTASATWVWPFQFLFQSGFVQNSWILIGCLNRCHTLVYRWTNKTNTQSNQTATLHCSEFPPCWNPRLSRDCAGWWNSTFDRLGFWGISGNGSLLRISISYRDCLDI